MEDLRVSIIIPTYNRAHLIRRSIQSALSQRRQGDEVIVVDDASTDNTEQVVSEFSSSVQYLRVPHGGAGRARNQGAAAARNPLVAFLDSDDEWMQGKLESQRRLMQARPEVAFCFSDFRVRVDGQDHPRYLRYWHEDRRSWDQILAERIRYSSIGTPHESLGDFWIYLGDLYPSLMHWLYVLTSSILVRKAMAGDQPWFAEDLTILEDWAFFGRLARAGAAAFFDIETTWQHGHAGPRVSACESLSRSHARLEILKRIWGADAEFQARHGATYRRLVDEIRLKRGKRLLLMGQKEEASECWEGMSSRPWYTKPLLALPAGVAALPRDVFVRLREALR